GEERHQEIAELPKERCDTERNSIFRTDAIGAGPVPQQFRRQHRLSSVDDGRGAKANQVEFERQRRFYSGFIYFNEVCSRPGFSRPRRRLKPTPTCSLAVYPEPTGDTNDSPQTTGQQRWVSRHRSSWR